MDVHVYVSGNSLDVEMLHDYEDVVSLAHCGFADDVAHDVAACNVGASCSEVMKGDVDDDVHSLESCEQGEDEEDLTMTSLGYSHVAATCVNVALQNGFDAEPAQTKEEEAAEENDEKEEAEEEDEEEEETEEELFEFDKFALDTAASMHFVDMGLSWWGADGQDSDVSTQLPEDA
eukprot:CAMPEP_0172901646 /NCGR_PEP_ID=MMETSP1075-20121228/166712_1 /TAXON_ID=2916 /ORGANISM="Ceratium fusus, Strain PA161109" /LENGTH=175 /DNA_ID=CAMNT_0013758091 /DNA_START=1 /DNA_END=525 /DNA_ORIENTATION=+